MPRPKMYKMIDQYDTYQLNQTNKESLKKIVRAILADNIAQLQYASIDWIDQYNSDDFRYYIGGALIDIKQKILDLKNAKTARKYVESNVNSKTSQMIVKQIYQLIKNTKELMKEKNSSSKYQLSKDHFITFLGRVEEIVSLVQEQQNTLQSLSRSEKLVQNYTKNSSLFSNQSLIELKQKTQDLHIIQEVLNSKSCGILTKQNYKKIENQINLFQNQIILFCQQIKILEMKVKQLQSQKCIPSKNFQFQMMLLEQKHKDQTMQLRQNYNRQIILLKQPQKLKIKGLYEELNNNYRQRNKILGIFSVDILQKCYDRKKGLVDLIEEKTKKKIIRSTFLYQYNTKDPDFNSYIVGHNNFLIIIQTEEGIFGAFSTSRIQKSFMEPPDTIAVMFQISTTWGLISFDFINKVNRIRHYNNKYIPSLAYDYSHLIVGNSDIKLQKGSNYVYSNFGRSASCFDSKGYNVDFFLKNGGQNEVKFISYECYQVIFEENK